MQLGWGETTNQCKLQQACPPPGSWPYVLSSCLGDAGTSAHLVMFWPDQGTDLAGEKSFLWDGWFPAGSVAVSVHHAVS